MSDIDFLKNINWIIDNLEGGDMLLKDADGYTKYGINSKAHPKISIPDLTREQAIEVYQHYRQQSHFDEYPVKKGIMYLDCYINMQTKYADKLVKDTGEISMTIFLDVFTLVRIFAYLAIVNKNPPKRANLRGWLNRCKKLYDYVNEQ